MTFSKKGLFLVLCLAATQVSAQKYVNRTFVALPRHGATAAHEFGAYRAHQKSDNDINTNIHACGFYAQSTNGDRLGKGLWVDGTNVINIATSDSDVTTYEHLPRYMLHDSAGTAYSALRGKITLSPLRKVWGVNLGAEHKLGFVNENLFVGINVPVMQVTHDLRANLTGETKVGTVGAMDYFLGTFEDTTGIDQQAKLTSAKFAGKAQSKTGVASVDLTVGYNLVNEEKAGVRARAFYRIPTGTAVTGEYLFEPILGNGRHHELGFGFDGSVELSHSEKLTIDLNASMALAYLFQATEKRTVNYRSYAGVSQGLLAAHYRNFGKSTVIGVQPGANILTVPLTVRPGVLLDVATDLSFRFGKFGFKAGYAACAKSAESATVQTFTDAVYALSNLDYAANTAFTLGTHNLDSQLSKSMLDTSNCTTPASLTHKVNGTLGWYPTVGNFDLCAEVHGGFDFAPQNNVNVEQFHVGAKLGLNF